MIHIVQDRFEEYYNWRLNLGFAQKVFDLLSECSDIALTGDVAIVRYRQGPPLCANPTPENLAFLAAQGVLLPDLPGLKRIVCLNAKAVRWSQWIYQLAHEGCHHLIDGTMSVQLSGENWFEESLCETASLFCLSKLSRHTIWQQWGCPRYALCVQSYLDNQLHESVFLRQSYYSWNNVEQSLGIRPWLGILGETSTQGITPEQRTLCNAVASLILPTFLRTPRLWEILGHIAPSENWQSLEALLAHLESKVAPDVSDAVRELRTVLLGD